MNTETNKKLKDEKTLMVELRKTVQILMLLCIAAPLSVDRALAASLAAEPVVKAGVEQAFSTQDRVRVLIKLKEDSQLPGRLTGRSGIKRLQPVGQVAPQALLDNDDGRID